MEIKVFKCGLYNSLCDHCVKCFSNCEVGVDVLEFGEGIGFDNVIQCDQFTPEEILPKGVSESTVDI